LDLDQSEKRLDWLVVVRERCCPVQAEDSACENQPTLWKILLDFVRRLEKVLDEVHAAQCCTLEMGLELKADGPRSEIHSEPARAHASAWDNPPTHEVAGK
jgi:hypothetical protein